MNISQFQRNTYFDKMEKSNGNDEGQTKTKSNKLSEVDKIKLHFKYSRNSKNGVESLIRKYMSGEKLPAYFYKLSLKEQRQWLHTNLKSIIQVLPDSMINLTVAFTYDGDCGNPMKTPNWLNMDKFRRGQKFARDNIFGLYYAMLLSLYIPFSFGDGLKPIIITGKSSTPYMAFRRYLSTTLRVRNWYTSDPWTKGTEAYKDIQVVRKMHCNIRRKLRGIKNEDVDSAAKIENLYCPTRDIILQDFQSSCPVPAIGQCPYMLLQNHEYSSCRPKPLNQADMAVTQFLFFGIVLLYPKAFGVHNTNMENFDAFCHTWMGLGYLLGIDDSFNLCHGTLDEIRKRCKELLELWVKPNLRKMTPEYEHMMRCVMGGLEFTYPSLTYESSLLYVSELLNIHTPRLHSILSYRTWIIHNLVKLFFFYISRLPGLMAFMNKKVNDSLDKAAKYSPRKFEKLRKKFEQKKLKMQELHTNHHKF